MRVLALFLLMSVGLLTGCPHSFVRPEFPHTDASVLLRSHDSMRGRVVSIRAEARVDQRGREGRIRGTVLMFVERPNRVRFDAMTQFGPAATLTSDGVAFALTDMRDNRFLRGPTCPENIALLIGIPLSGEDVGNMLLGSAPRIGAERTELTITDDGLYRVTLHGANGERQEIDYTIRDADEHAQPNEQRLRLIRTELYDASGATRWRALYEDYRVLPLDEMGVAMPYEVRFFDPARDTDVQLRFQTIDLNVEVPAEAFHQEPPPAVQVEEAPCD